MTEQALPEGEGHSSHAVRLLGLSKSFQDTRAVEDVTLEVARGEVIAIVGPSGCGKTTTLRLVAGFESPDHGEVWIDDRRVAGGGDWRAPERRGIGVVFQDYALFPHLRVIDNVAFGLSRLPRKERRDRSDEMLQLVGLSGLERRYPYELSGGQQQRVALARALAPRPLVLLLDEPFSNLDAEMRTEVRLEVRQILKRLETTAIFVTHDQEEAFVFADRVAVMNSGRLEQVGTPEELYNSPGTLFVADFIGHGNFVAGTVGKEGIDTELGTLALPRVDLVPGTTVRILVRPHDIALTREHENQALEIIERRFFGSEVEYVLRLASGRRLLAHLPPESAFVVGDRVGYELRLANLRVF